MGSATKHEIFCPVCGISVKRCEWERGETWSADGWRIDTWTYHPCGHVVETSEVKKG
jgi:hypothetical protein